MTDELFDSKGRPIIVLANPDDSPDLFDAAGRPYRVVDGGVYFEGSSGAGGMSEAEELTINASTEDITPTLSNNLIIRVKLAGAGGLPDTLKKINAGIAWAGKMLLLEASDGGMAITIQHNSNIVMTSDFTMDSPDDNLLLLWKSVDKFAQAARNSNA